MASSDGKIKFGFTAKPKGPLGKSPASSFIPKKNDGREKIEFIENNAIKTSGKQDAEAPKLLVIPPPQANKTAAQILQSASDSKQKQSNVPVGKDSPGAPKDNETLEQRAAREIVEEMAEATVKKEEANNFVVPLRPDQLPLDGARQSNLDDYESVPIEQFGLAMLRGMGFKENPVKEDDKIMPGPAPRPKGLGLGADRAVKEGVSSGNRSTVQDENLVMKCGVPVKIRLGKHQGKYGLIKSFDDDTGRVMVQMSIGKEQEWLTEHSLQLITMQEYNKNSNVINSVKYEQYKDREKNVTTTSSKSEPSTRRKSVSPHRSRGSRRESSSQSSEDDSEPSRRHRKSHKEVSRKEYAPRTSSGTKKKSHKYKQRREYRRDDRRRDSSRDRQHRRAARSSDSSDASDDRVHKKKTKKKKRPRSRSRSRS